MSAPTSNEIVIAIDHPKNSDVYFYPINEAVRSRFLPSRSGGRMPPVLSQWALTGFPGQRIHLDVKARRGRITDEMGDPQNEAMLEEVKRKCKASSRPMQVGDPVKDKVYENLSPEDIQTWLYWMVRFCEDQVRSGEDRKPLGTMARLVQGSLPSRDDVVSTGKVRRPLYHADLMKEGAPKYYKLPKAEPELVGAGK